MNYKYFTPLQFNSRDSIYFLDNKIIYKKYIINKNYNIEKVISHLHYFNPFEYLNSPENCVLGVGITDGTIVSEYINYIISIKYYELKRNV